MPETTNEYRVVLKNNAGAEVYVTHDWDYHLMTLDKAMQYAEARKMDADARVQVRQIIITDWSDV